MQSKSYSSTLTSMEYTLTPLHRDKSTVYSDRAYLLEPRSIGNVSLYNPREVSLSFNHVNLIVYPLIPQWNITSWVMKIDNARVYYEL